MAFVVQDIRLIASTYGDSFEPWQVAPPHVLAGNFDEAPAFATAFTRFRREWSDHTSASPKNALVRACADLGVMLTDEVGGGPYEIDSADPSYQPIFDEFGNVIGHITIGWVLLGGAAIVKRGLEFSDGAGKITLTAVAGVLLSVVQRP